VAYRNPAFISRHYGAEVGVAAISSSVAAAAGFGKERLIDYRLGNNFKFSTVAAGHWVEFDLGALGGVAVNRLIMPAGHNLVGITINTKSGASSPATTSRGSTNAGAGLSDFTLTESTDRYWRIEFGVAASDDWEMPELWLGRYRQTTTGIVQSWEAPWLSPVVRREFPSRESMLVTAPARRRWELEHKGLTGTDLAIYDELLPLGVGVPFWFYPPDDAVTGPLLMLLEDDGDREQDHPVPNGAAGPSYEVSLAMREQTS